jgi:hypothetical protein
MFMFKRAYRLNLSWASYIQSTSSHRISLLSILFQLFLIHLGLAIILFPSDFRTKLYAFFISLVHAAWSTYFILFDFIILIIFDEE